jgi:hypothetical protein
VNVIEWVAVCVNEPVGEKTGVADGVGVRTGVAESVAVGAGEETAVVAVHVSVGVGAAGAAGWVLEHETVKKQINMNTVNVVRFCRIHPPVFIFTLNYTTPAMKKQMDLAFQAVRIPAQILIAEPLLLL